MRGVLLIDTGKTPNILSEGESIYELVILDSFCRIDVFIK